MKHVFQAALMDAGHINLQRRNEGPAKTLHVLSPDAKPGDSGGASIIPASGMLEGARDEPTDLTSYHHLLCVGILTLTVGKWERGACLPACSSMQCSLAAHACAVCGGCLPAPAHARVSSFGHDVRTRTYSYGRYLARRYLSLSLAGLMRRCSKSPPRSSPLRAQQPIRATQWCTSLTSTYSTAVGI